MSVLPSAQVVDPALRGSPLDADAWLGEEGSWAPGHEPPDVPVQELKQSLKIMSGDSWPPGPCDGKCPCGQNAVAIKAGDSERPWMTADRSARVLAAMNFFEGHAGVVRRGRVSGQRRFEPALAGWHERSNRQPVPNGAPSLHPPAGVDALIV